MLAVVDAFEAMTVGRPYREPLSEAEALVELRRCAGTQFDPRVVEEFGRMVDEGRRRRRPPPPSSRARPRPGGPMPSVGLLWALAAAACSSSKRWGGARSLRRELREMRAS